MVEKSGFDFMTIFNLLSLRSISRDPLTDERLPAWLWSRVNPAGRLRGNRGIMGRCRRSFLAYVMENGAAFNDLRRAHAVQSAVIVAIRQNTTKQQTRWWLIIFTFCTRRCLYNLIFECQQDRNNLSPVSRFETTNVCSLKASLM